MHTFCSFIPSSENSRRAVKLDKKWDFFRRIADQLFSVFSSKAEEAAPEAPAEKPPTLEEVRAILAEKARAGFTSEVRELLGRYGANRLSAADPKHYAAIVKEAEVLGNAG